MAEMHPKYPSLTKEQVRSLQAKTTLPLALGAVVIVIALSHCMSAKSPEFLKCTELGIEFYKEVGSYPFLQSKELRGKSTKEHVEEICRRNSRAFDNYGRTKGK